MRYSIDARRDYENILLLVIEVGGQNIKRADRVGLIFADLSDEGVKALREKGIVVKPVRDVYAQQVAVPPTVQPYGGTPFSGYDIAYGMLVTRYREYGEELTGHWIDGTGYNLAILDTGVRKTHELFGDRVKYERNFSTSPTCGDIFGHGTSCAGLAAGGESWDGNVQGMAPGANILNIKVLNDEGMGTDESACLAIDHLIGMKLARDPLAPHVINMSFGGPDVGDPNDPIRLACNKAYESYMLVVAAAGNTGPDPGTVTSPACDPKVLAIGAIHPATFALCNFSSRGPTKEGNFKPDAVFFGDDLELADVSGDSAYKVKAGTSFACAGLSGIWILARQYADIWLAWPGLTPEDIAAMREEFGWVYGEGWDWLWQALPDSCTPEGATPVPKNNAYGWGIPLTKTIEELGGLKTGASGISELISPVASIIFLAVLLRLVAGAVIIPMTKKAGG
jgi:serine protease AprX